VSGHLWWQTSQRQYRLLLEQSSRGPAPPTSPSAGDPPTNPATEHQSPPPLQHAAIRTRDGGGAGVEEREGEGAAVTPAGGQDAGLRGQGGVGGDDLAGEEGTGSKSMQGHESLQALQGGVEKVQEPTEGKVIDEGMRLVFPKLLFLLDGDAFDLVLISLSLSLSVSLGQSVSQSVSQSVRPSVRQSLSLSFRSLSLSLSDSGLEREAET